MDDMQPTMIEYPSGNKVWYLHARRHRTDGPALEYPNGYKEWYIKGKLLSFDEWLEQNSDLTGEEKVMMKLQYG
jgi:hypothetical protein